MKEKHKIYGVILILVFLLLVIVEPLWKLCSLEMGNTSKFIKENDNSVFMKINNMTAGDCAQDTFIVKNNLKYPFHVKLQCEKVIDDKNYSILLEQLNIAIMCKGKELYKGLLAEFDKVNNSYIDLGMYEASEEKGVNIKIYLNNQLKVDNEIINELNIMFTTNNNEGIIFLENNNDISEKIPKFKESHYIFLAALPIMFKLSGRSLRKENNIIC